MINILKTGYDERTPTNLEEAKAVKKENRKKGCKVLSMVLVVLMLFSIVPAIDVYAQDRRLPAAVFPEFRVNTYDRPGGQVNGFFDERTTGLRIDNWGYRDGNNNEWWRVSFNTFSGGRAERRFVRRQDLIRNNTWTDVILAQDTRVFERSNLARQAGTVWGGQRARDRGANYSVVLAERGNAVMIVHIIDTGGGRIGWINRSAMENATRRSDDAVWRNGGWQSGGNAGGVATSGGGTGSAAGVAAGHVAGSWQFPMAGAWSTWGNSLANNGNWGGRSSSRIDRPFHAGIDMAGSNRNVNAAAAGEVVVARNTHGANGNIVVIRHRMGNTNVYSFYGHLASFSVRAGQNVNRGQQIGIMGNTGAERTSSGHLHFSITDRLVNNGDFVGWVAQVNGNRATHGGVTFFNPVYVINNNRLPR